MLRGDLSAPVGGTPDELIAQGNASTDPAKREALLTQAAKLAMDDYPLIPLLQYSVPRLIKPWVGG